MVRTKKTEPKENFFRNFTEEQISSVISYLIGGEKFAAISAYREIDNEASSEEVIMRVIEISSKIREWLTDKDFAMRHVPSICCINCMGRCGEWRSRMLDGGFNKSSCMFEGTGCSSFVSAKDFIKEGSGKQVRMIVKDDVSKNLRYLVCIKVENKICSVSYEVFNTRQRMIVKSKKRIFIVDSENVLKHIVKKTRNSSRGLPSMDDTQDTLTVHGKDPKKTEKTYLEYFNRCQKEIREENQKKEKEIYSLSYEDACTEFMKLCSPSEKSIIASMGGNIKEYLRNFYNGMSVWQVLESIKIAR